MQRPKHILSIDDLSVDFVKEIIRVAYSMKDVLSRDVKKLPTLRGKMLVNLFYEPSTRTRVSFEIAAKNLSAEVINFSAAGSSVEKGESLRDTIKTVEKLGADFIVIRHPSEGASHFAAEVAQVASIINGGDGKGEHPTQALLDLFTIVQELSDGDIDSLRNITVTYIGDILHSRVARSGIKLFRKLGMKTCVCAPSTLLPRGIESVAEVKNDLYSALKESDVAISLRLQKERQQGVYFSDLREYNEFWEITDELISKSNPNIIIMHPGPMNIGVEIEPKVAYGKQSVILKQVENGVAVRMAIIYLLFVGE